jgi:hypothetical protein
MSEDSAHLVRRILGHHAVAGLAATVVDALFRAPGRMRGGLAAIIAK